MAAKRESTRYCSFFLRLWQEAETGAPATWHGEIESIQTGQKWRFDSLRAMFDFLQARFLGEIESRCP